MRLEKKTLGRREWSWMQDTHLTVEAVEGDGFFGVAGLLYIGSVTKPLAVPSPKGSLTIADGGYRWLQLAPKGEHWWLTVLIDREDRLLESYFDITRENDFTDPLAPFFWDMKLDVTAAPWGQPRILDREELEETLEAGIISREEHVLALETAQKIVSGYKEREKEYFRFLCALYRRLSHGRELQVPRE